MSRHVCEHVLRQLSRVVARDSSIAVAGVQDLYVALCEDESIWGLFKRLQGKLRYSNLELTDSQRVPRISNQIRNKEKEPDPSLTIPKSPGLLHTLQELHSHFDIVEGYLTRSISTIVVDTYRAYRQFSRKGSSRSSRTSCFLIF